MSVQFTLSPVPIAMHDKYVRDGEGRLWRKDLSPGTTSYQYATANEKENIASQIGRLPRGMWFICPCGCGNLGWLWFRHATTSTPSWEFSGPIEAPTLHPSIQKLTPCKWHGWLQQGVFKC